MWWASREIALERAVLAARLDETLARLAQAEHDRDYWRHKAELLLDSTLFRRGEVTQHVFSAPPKPSTDHTLGSVFGPLAVTEIDSAVRRSPSPGNGRHPDPDAR